MRQHFVNDSAAIGLLFAACLGGIYSGIYPLQLAAGLALIAFLPGFALLRILRPISLPETWPVWGAASVALSYGISVVALLLLIYTAGTVTREGVWIALALWLLGLLLVAWRWRPTAAVSPSTIKPSSRRFLVGLGLILAVALFLRVAGLHYSDWLGDEAEVVLRAAQVIRGQPDALLTHTKGPAEILITAAVGALTNRLDEFTLRLPFAIASLAGLAGVGLLAHRLFGPTAGIIAAALLAFNGLMVTNARITQYQSLALVFNVWAAWYFFTFYAQRHTYLLLVGTSLLAAGFLTHFEVILLTPLPLFLLWQLWQQQPSTHRTLLPAVAAAGVLVVGLAALFYVPTLLHPQLDDTGNYLAGRIGSEWVYNNFPHFYITNVTYNSIYYLLLTGALLLIALLLTLWQAWPGPPPRFWPALLAIALLLAALIALAPGVAPFVLFATCAIGLIFLAVSSRLSITLRGLFVWGGPAFLVYLFLVARPGSHYIVFFPAAVTLAGWGAAQIFDRLGLRSHRRVQAALAALLAVGLALSAAFQYILVVRNDLEYILTYPLHQQPLFPTDPRFPFNTRIGFGFPFRLGWQMVEQLYRTGDLQGDWSANDDGNALEWYTRGQPRIDCYPNNYFAAAITYQGDDPTPAFDLAAYSLRYNIHTNDRLRMQVYVLDPLGEITGPTDLTEPGRYTSAVTVETLLADSPPVETRPPTLLAPPTHFSLSTQAKANLAARFDPRIVDIRDKVALTGYHIDDTWAQPGGAILATLYWQATEPLHLPLKVFVHLNTPGGIISGDDFPACGAAPMPTWPLNKPIEDRHLLRLPADVAPGEYPLEIGIYEPETNIRMDRLDEAGNPAGLSLPLPNVTITAGD